MPGQNQAPGEVMIGYNGDGQPEYGPPPVAYNGPTRLDEDGRPIGSANLSNPSDLQNVRMAYTQLHDLSDDAVRLYLRNAGVTGSFQLGDHLTSNNAAFPLTQILDNSKQWWDYVAPLAIGGLAAAGGAGLFGAEALGGGGAGVGAGAGGGALATGAEALPAWAGGVPESLTLGGGAAGTGLGGASLAGAGLTTAEGVGTGFAAGGGALGGAGIDAATPFSLSNNPTQYAPDAPGNSPGMQPNLPPGAQSVLSKLLSGGTLTSQDIAQLVGAGGTTLAGLFGADATRSANNSAADKMLALGAPARAEFNRTIQPGFDPSTMPGYTSAIDSVMNSYLRKASTGGNPFTNPGVSMEANKYVTDSTALPALNNYRNTLVNAGNTGVGGAAAPNAAAAGAPNQATNAVAGGLGSLSAQPAQDYSQVLKQILNLGQAVV